MVVPNNHGFSYQKWSAVGVEMGVPPFKETPIQLVATKLEPNMTHMWEDSTHQLEDHFPQNKRSIFFQITWLMGSWNPKAKHRLDVCETL